MKKIYYDVIDLTKQHDIVLPNNGITLQKNGYQNNFFGNNYDIAKTNLSVLQYIDKKYKTIKNVYFITGAGWYGTCDSMHFYLNGDTELTLHYDTKLHEIGISVLGNLAKTMCKNHKITNTIWAILKFATKKYFGAKLDEMKHDELIVKSTKHFAQIPNHYASILIDTNKKIYDCWLFQKK